MVVGTGRSHNDTSHRAIELAHKTRSGRGEEHQAIALFLLVLQQERFCRFVGLRYDLHFLYALHGVETLHAIGLDISGRESLDDIQILTLQTQISLQRIHAGRLIDELLTQTGAVTG